MTTPAEFLFLSALSFSFGVTKKLADGHHEHGLDLFPGAGIFFGILSGGIAFYLIGYSPVLQAAYLGPLLYWLYKRKVDCIQHFIMCTLMLFGVFLSKGNFAFPLGGVLLVFFGYTAFDWFKRHNPWPATAPILARPWWFHFHLTHLILAIAMGNILGYTSLCFNLLGILLTNRILLHSPGSTKMQFSSSGQVRSFYDKIHPDYCELKSRPHFQTDMIEKYNMLKMVGNGLSGKSLLDIGCGLGFHLREYEARGAGTFGLDLCGKHIDFAAAQSPSTCFAVGDFLEHDFKGELFDIVTSSLVINHLNLQEKALFFRKVHTVLKRGGMFFFSDKNPVIEGLDFVSDNEAGFLDIWKLDSSSEGYFSENKRIPKPYYGAEMIKYHATYQAIIGLILESGFTIRGYSDCFPDPQSAEAFPEEFAYFSRIPQFFVFKVYKE